MRALPILTLVCALPAASAAAQESPFAEEQEVTAVDVALELAGGAPAWLPGRQTPDARDLTALVDGASVPVVAVQAPADRFERVVIYLDLPLSDDYQLTWAALLLADRAEALVKLGPVEVVAAAPDPRTVLSPTTDVAALEEALARLAFLGAAEDRLVELRLDHEAASSTVAAERRLVVDRLDALLLALVERTDGPDPRRAAIVVSGGFDLDGDPAIAQATVEVGRVLAAYGWRLLPLLAPEQAGPIPGVRIGKWRIFGIAPGSQGLPIVPLLLATREEDRDPELAEAHLELAATLLRQGELERAADEAEAALKHFAGDPRTAKRQAAALVLSSDVHRALGDPQRARRELRRAARFDPEAVAGSPVAAAVPDGASEALALLVAPGGGAPVRGEGDFDRALARSLGRRTLITVQLPGSPDEALHDVEIRRAGHGAVLATGWLRYGTPEAVAAARSRHE